MPSVRKNRRDSSEEPIFVQSDSSDEDDIDDSEAEHLSKTRTGRKSIQAILPKTNLLYQPIGDGKPPSAELATETSTGIFRGFYGRPKTASIPVVSAGPLRPVRNVLVPQDVTLRPYELSEGQFLNEESASLNAEHGQRTSKHSALPKFESDVAIGTISDSILAESKTNPDSRRVSYPGATTTSGYAKSSTKATA